MPIICPECKNSLDIASNTLAAEQIIECPMCGITLQVKIAEGSNVQLEVVDEGK